MRFLLIFVITMLLLGCTMPGGAPPSATPTPTPAPEPITQEPLPTTQDPRPETKSPPPTNNPLPTTNDQEPKTNNQLTVYFFYSPFCNASQAIWPEIELLEARYNNSVTFKKYSVLNSGDLEEYNKFAIEYNLSNRVVPIVYFKNETLIGRFEINDSLESFIKNELEE